MTKTGRTLLSVATHTFTPGAAHSNRITQMAEVTGRRTIAKFKPTLYSLESHFGLVGRQVHLLSGV